MENTFSKCFRAYLRSSKDWQFLKGWHSISKFADLEADAEGEGEGGEDHGPGDGGQDPAAQSDSVVCVVS